MENIKSYKEYLKCLGNICGYCCCTYQSIQTSQTGMLERYGKFKKYLQPGLHYYNPFTQNIVKVAMRTKVINLPPQIVYNKQNMSITIDMSLFYRVLDAYKATYYVKDIERSIIEKVFTIMRIICGEYNLADLRKKTFEINHRIKQQFEKSQADWGVHLERIVLKDMKLGDIMRNKLIKVNKPIAIAKTEAAIISAEGDLESAKLYREASDILDMDAAMQIRFLDTLQTMNLFKSKQMTIIPLKPNYDGV